MKNNNLPIKLIKSTFYNESETKQQLCDYISSATTLSMGEQTVRFEQQFAEKQARRFAIFVNSGSSANLVVIQALLNCGRIKKGARIGISALTWATNVMPVLELGLTPVAIDCELDTLNVSSATLEPVIDSLDALFITNVLGFCDDLPRIATVCKEKGVLLLEDNCESLGSKTNNVLLGNFGVASTFSFFVGHHLSTIEGGMIATDDEELYYAITMVRAHGWDRQLPPEYGKKLRDQYNVEEFFARYTFYDLAYNVRATDIQAFVGTTQLSYWDTIVSRREEHFRLFANAIAGNNALITLRVGHMDIISNFAVPLICANEQSAMDARQKFIDAHVEVRPIIAGNITQQPFYRKYVAEPSSLPRSERVHRCGFYFGNSPELTDDELNRLTGLIEEVRVV